MPLVTLVTDFGTVDGYVGAMKGVLLSLAPAAVVVDITHEVPRHDVAAGAFALAQAARFFPAGAIHVAVVDPGVGGRRRGVVIAHGGHFFVGPDNGVFALAVDPARATAFEIASPEFRRETDTATFHGRDVFAPAAARLANGARPAAAGPEVPIEGTLGHAPASVSADGREVTGHVVHVDRFGNLVTDIPAPAIPAGAKVRVGSGPLISRISRTYEDVPRGRSLAYVGSAGTLEVAVREGSAARRLGLRRGAKVTVRA